MLLTLASGTQSFVSLGLWEIFATLANTFILYLIIKKFFFKPVKAMMDRRENEIKNSFAEAEALKNDSIRVKEEYEGKMDKASEAAAMIVSDARREAGRRSDEIIEEARENAQIIITEAEKRIETEKRKAVNEAKNEIAELSVMMAEKIIEKTVDKSDSDRLIGEFLISGEQKNEE